jgi:hypothetical protein
MTKFKYLGMTPTELYCKEEEIKSKLNSGNACYHSLDKLLCYHLLSKDIKIYVYTTINFFCFLEECDTWSVILRTEHRLRVCENRVMRKIFGLKRKQGIGDWRKLQHEELHDWYSSPNIIWVIK